jgi:glutamate dehydrogenase
MEHIENGNIVTRSPATPLEATSTELQRLVDPGEADLVSRFAELFFAKAPAEFFLDRPPDMLAALALSAFRHLQRSRPDQVNVDVMQPEAEAAPWSAPVTVIRTNVTERSFIVGSIREYLHARFIPVERFLHPVMRVVRDASGAVVDVGPAAAGVPLESVVHCEVGRIGDDEVVAEIRTRIRESLEDVVAVTDDFGAMVNALNETVASLEEAARRLPERSAEIEEVQEFLRWLRQGFIFIGYCGYDFVDSPDGRAAVVEPGSLLGVLRREHGPGAGVPVPLAELPPEMRERVADDSLFIMSKTNDEATVHRRVRMDAIGVKKLDAAGRPVGERHFRGLFTSRAYAEDAERIPILRRKLRTVMEQAGWREGSHDYKEAITIFNSMPKEELFLASAEEIGKEIEAILTRYHTQEVKVTLRRDSTDRGVSIMVIMPRERYSGRTRRALQAELVRQLEGSLLNYHLVMGGGHQARLHFYIAAQPERLDLISPDQIEHTVRQLIRTWTDQLEVELAVARPADEARRLADRWGAAFSLEYQAATTPADALADLEVIEAMEADGRAIALRLTNPDPADFAGAEPVTRLKVYLRGERLVLSDFMPILEDAGLRVISMSPFEVTTAEGYATLISVFAVQDADGRQLDLEQSAARLTETILAVRSDEACSDSLNALVLSADLAWREVDVLRGYCEYAFQLKIVPSRLALPTALLSYPDSARALMRVFRKKFDPARRWSAGERARRVEEARAAFIRTLEHVTSLTDDRALRRLLALIDATARTNYYLHGGATPSVRSGGVPYISYKFLSELLQPLVKTRLRAEVWVQSARMAGIHMRRGKVSRGGLRHSDRPDDFRTEVLGLVRTQSVKNAVIVPAGSKGGFITRRQPADPQALAAEVEAQYRTFIRGLLDITDNLVDNELARPAGLVVHDEVDPYLVVAADKGTAKFSDVANSVAAEYDFWLDDAFASGGSNGYDHKKFGITARGAWECVRRHFRELGHDIQTEPFTVVGIGDMSGDVFGNGMLLSHQIRLVAAFDHRHIFVDPTPDAAASYAERQRLFGLGRSSWADYDRAILSAGGFIVPRGVKEIELSAEARAALGIAADVTAMDGESLIQAILRAPVDLLWNGGIGTYVKGAGETHSEAGDPANDSVRIDGTELRCRVLGEGGNLGLTQRGRIEFALAGGRCYTDAIDNSGGVEMSDREVNLKILLNAAMADGRLDREQRNVLLQDLADSVNEKVLDDNRSQSLAVSLDVLRASRGFQDFHGFMLALERNRVMDRAAEALPSLEVLVERWSQGMSLLKPEFSVLLAYAKLTLKQSLLASTVLDDPAMESYLVGYFPERAVHLVGPAPLASHRLRREIIATGLANDMVDLMGTAFVYRTTRDTGASDDDVARAWFIAASLCGATELRQRLSALEGEIPSDIVYRWLLGLARVLERTTRWVLANIDAAAPAAQVVDQYIDGLRRLRGDFGSVVAGQERELFETRIMEMRDLTHNEELAASLITLRFLDQILEILKVAHETGRPAVRVGRAYYLAAELLAVPKLRQALAEASGQTRWDQRAAQTLTEDLGRAHRRLTAAVVAAGGEEPVEESLGVIQSRHAEELQSYHELLADIGTDERPTLAALIIAVRQLSAFEI